MGSKKNVLKNAKSRQSPKNVLDNLKTFYNNEELLRAIELQIDFTNNKTFFHSLKTFLNSFEDSNIIDMLFNSSIKDLWKEMELYKRAEQSIIKTINRPVFLINNDAVNMGITSPWSKHINENTATIASAIRSVGRIEMTGEDRKDWVGTGWLLKNTNIIVTNRHVAKNFTTTQNGKSKIRENWAGDQYGVQIDFKEEHATKNKLEFNIKKVVYIAKERELDIALLSVEQKNYKGQELPEGLEISHERPNLKEDVYIIGYPDCDNNEELRNKNFNGVAEAKQFAPGNSSKTGAHKYIYLHDCTTWNGNSGSPLIEFKSGKVIGIHYGGTDENHKGFFANYAVSTKILTEILVEHKIPHNH